MSSSTHEPATPEKEGNGLKQKFNSAKGWFSQRTTAGLHWLLLLAVVALLSLDAWYIGIVALAWHHIVPTIKWYYSVGTDTKRNLRWSLGRFGIFAVTAGLFAWLWIDEGFEMAVILPILIGISIPLFKKSDWTMLAAIWAGVVLFAEFGNGASLAAAILISAVVQYERRKFEIANREARRVNLFEQRDLSQRPVREFRPTGGGLADRPRVNDAGPYSDRPVDPNYGMSDPRPRLPRPAEASETGIFQVPEQLPGADETGATARSDENGPHTVELRIPPQQDGPPKYRRPLHPPIQEDEGPQYRG